MEFSEAMHLANTPIFSWTRWTFYFFTFKKKQRNAGDLKQSGHGNKTGCLSEQLDHLERFIVVGKNQVGLD